jgi:hypothetical protein
MNDKEKKNKISLIGSTLQGAVVQLQIDLSDKSRDVITKIPQMHVILSLPKPKIL